MSSDRQSRGRARILLLTILGLSILGSQALGLQGQGIPPGRLKQASKPMIEQAPLAEGQGVAVAVP